MSQKKNLRAENSLSRFIEGPAINNDVQLRQLLETADQLPDAVLITLDYSTRSFEHVGKGIQSLIGYNAQEMLNKGTAGIISITEPEEVPYLTAVQSAYVQQARATQFDTRSVVFHEYAYSVTHHSGHKVPVVSLIVMLTYGLQRQLVYGVGFIIPRDERMEATIGVCKGILREIKIRHNEVYEHRDYVPSRQPLPKHHYDEIVDNITSREREVLAMMAQGHSSSQIATELSITTNTVESHRKKLLEKFQARNAAELIHKASKVFWLE